MGKFAIGKSRKIIYRTASYAFYGSTAAATLQMSNLASRTARILLTFRLNGPRILESYSLSNGPEHAIPSPTMEEATINDFLKLFSQIKQSNVSTSAHFLATHYL